jgi:hypothetical protein
MRKQSLVPKVYAIEITDGDSTGAWLMSGSGPVFYAHEYMKAGRA